jgi:hypothetical protein
LDQYIAVIKKCLPLVPAELMFNIDEGGFSDWEERKAEPVFIQSTVRNMSLHSPADHELCHPTLIS